MKRQSLFTRLFRRNREETKRARSGGRFGRQMQRQWIRWKVIYQPGRLGISAVSKAIMKDYSEIRSRRERKELARKWGEAFQSYYNA